MSCVILHLYTFIFLLNCINENIEVTESRVLAEPHLNELAILILNSTGKLYNCYSSHILQAFLFAAIFMNLLHKGPMSLIDTFLISLIRLLLPNTRILNKILNAALKKCACDCVRINTDTHFLFRVSCVGRGLTSGLLLTGLPALRQVFPSSREYFRRYYPNKRLLFYVICIVKAVTQTDIVEHE